MVKRGKNKIIEVNFFTFIGEIYECKNISEIDEYANTHIIIQDKNET